VMAAIFITQQPPQPPTPLIQENATIKVSEHGQMGDSSLIEMNRSYLKTLQTRISELKREGKTLEQASETVSAELKSRYPDLDWKCRLGRAFRLRGSKVGHWREGQ